MNIITNSVLNMKYAFHAENRPKLTVNDVRWMYTEEGYLGNHAVNNCEIIK